MHTQLACFGKQRIIDIRDIANTTNGVSAIDESTLKDVVDKKGCSVPKMRGVVWRDATRVHKDSVSGCKRNNFAPRRVVQPHAHERYA